MGGASLGKSACCDAHVACYVAVADVVDVKEHLGIDEYIDVAVEPLPLSISPSEIYAIHRIIAQDIDEIVRTSLFLVRVGDAHCDGPSSFPGA